MKPFLVLTAVAAAAATFAAAPASAHYATSCSAKQPAQAQLRCATRNVYHAQGAIRWAKRIQQRRLTAFDSKQQIVLAAMIRNHRWLLAESRRDQKQARHRLSRILPETNDWATAVRVVQRVFPGSRWWQLACSSSEGGHGAWVYFGHYSYPLYGPDTTPGGPMQYMQGTFWHDFNRGLAIARERGFVVPRSASSWYSMLGQAIASGYAYHYNRPAGKWTGSRC